MRYSLFFFLFFSSLLFCFMDDLSRFYFIKDNTIDFCYVHHVDSDYMYLIYKDKMYKRNRSLLGNKYFSTYTDAERFLLTGTSAMDKPDETPETAVGYMRRTGHMPNDLKYK